jgi:transposase-like protein
MSELRTDTPHRIETTAGPSGQAVRPGGKKLPLSGADSGTTTTPVPEDIQRWTARRRMALVLSVLKGELSEEDGARRHGLAVAEIADWRDRVLQAAHNALRSRPRDTDAIKDDQIRRLRQKIGELVVDVDVLKEALQIARSSHDADPNDD